MQICRANNVLISTCFVHAVGVVKCLPFTQGVAFWLHFHYYDSKFTIVNYYYNFYCNICINQYYCSSCTLLFIEMSVRMTELQLHPHMRM